VAQRGDQVAVLGGPEDGALSGRLAPRAADLRLAHGFARIGLGMDMALHGMTRLPDMATFSGTLEKQFANTFLPQPLVTLAAYCIAYSETAIGIALLLGLFVRLALIGNAMLMIILLFGTCLVMNFTVAATQLLYLAFITVLLATVAYDGLSLDSLRRAKR
jgi:thiosulfate dehydrogenase [quinone] large subunit